MTLFSGASTIAYTSTSAWYGATNSVTSPQVWTLQGSNLSVVNYPNATTIWNTWATANTITGLVTAQSLDAWTVWNQAPAVLSAETKRRLKREQAEMDKAAKLRREKNEEAKRKARALLTAQLTPQQRDSLERLGYFDVDIAGKQYRIRQGTHGNVRLLEAGKETVSFCAQPNGVPAEDAMLAQKLMLETDEAAFLRVANARRL